MKMPAWFKVFFGFTILCLIVAIGALYFAENEVSVVEDQLETLSAKKFSEAYYEYTAKEFQEETSLPDFREFVRGYPVLVDNRSFEVTTKVTIDGIVMINGTLISRENQVMRVIYHLKKEEEEWKVLSIVLEEADEGLESVIGKMVQVVQDQLQELRDNDFVEAYYSYVSKDFQADTPLTEFQKFVDSYPILSKFTDMNLRNRRIEDGEGFVTVVLKLGDEAYPIDFKLIKEDGIWKVFSLRVTLPSTEAQKKIATDPQALIPPVKELHEALFDQNVEKAYHSTAPAFQEATSFEDFQHFVSLFPVLTNPDITDFKQGSIEDSSGKLRVNLHDKRGITVIEYTLGLEEGRWEIWGMKVVEEPEEIKSSQTVVDDPLDNLTLVEKFNDIVEGQLVALRHFNLASAYHDFTSEEYQEIIPFEAFEQFIEENLQLTRNRAISLKKVMMDANEAKLLGVLTLLDYRDVPIEYRLVAEDGNWKIDYVQILNTDKLLQQEDYISIEEFTAPPVKPLFIEKIEMGTDLDVKGEIAKPAQVFRPNDRDLYVNIHLENGTVGTTVMLYFEHIDSGSGIPPLTTHLGNEGDVIVTFSYEAPENGWPEGEYVLKATSSNGKELLQHFKVMQ